MEFSFEITAFSTPLPPIGGERLSIPLPPIGGKGVELLPLLQI